MVRAHDFIASLILIVVAGLLAAQADREAAHPKRFEVAAGLILMVGLSLIGWGLNFRH